MTTMTLGRTGVLPGGDFPARLTMARIHMGYTQRQMAGELGLKQSTYAHYESGRNNPRNMVQFCLALHMITGIDLGWLMTGEVPTFGGHDGDGLPLMDSNHQPCDSRHTSRHNSALRMAA